MFKLILLNHKSICHTHTCSFSLTVLYIDCRCLFIHVSFTAETLEDTSGHCCNNIHTGVPLYCQLTCWRKVTQCLIWRIVCNWQQTYKNKTRVGLNIYGYCIVHLTPVLCDNNWECFHVDDIRRQWQICTLYKLHWFY